MNLGGPGRPATAAWAPKIVSQGDFRSPCGANFKGCCFKVGSEIFFRGRRQWPQASQSADPEARGQRRVGRQGGLLLEKGLLKDNRSN